MRFCCWLSGVVILVISFIPTIQSHAISARLFIHELVEESDIVFVGRVTGVQSVISNPHTHPYNSLEETGGSLYRIRIDQVFYGEDQIKQAVFPESSVSDINQKLKRQRKRDPVMLSAFQNMRSRHTEGPVFYENESQLFFLKVSKFPAPLPDTTVILDENWSSHGDLSQVRTKSDLSEKYYFEASFNDRQATWLLSDKRKKKKMQSVEAFCEVMSVPNLVQKKRQLQRLLNSSDKLLAGAARAVLREMNQPKPQKKKRNCLVR